MTPEQIVVAAMGICSDYTDSYPTTRSIMYQRISARQRELFAHIATLDPEFYGAEAVVEVVDGAANIGALEQSGDVYPVERIQLVQIEDPGQSVVRVAGEGVTLVRATDAHAFFPPRATYRSGVIRGVEDDLDGVASILVYYSRRPRTIGPDGAGEIELLEPFQYLLVYDLSRDLILRTVGIEGDKKAAALAMIERAEKELMEGLAEHIRHAARAREDRFAGA